ncbi:MAG: hypothetical protein U0R78_09825 [Nocardioidaceae bacterium]
MGATITSVDVLHPGRSSRPEQTGGLHHAALAGRRIEGVRRRGKYSGWPSMKATPCSATSG